MPTTRQKVLYALIGVIISIVRANAFSISFSTSRRTTTFLAANKSASEPQSLSIHYSYSFQRHVILLNGQHILESFEFLDDAREKYPSAELVPVKDCGLIAGGGREELTAYANTECDLPINMTSIIAAIPLSDNVVEIVAKRVPSTRFSAMTPERVRTNFQQLQALLESKLGLTSVAATIVVNNFPQVLLYSPRHVEERLEFLLAPPPPFLSNKPDKMDWPLLASQGFGAGWSIEQVRQALQAVPHVVLSMHLEDTFAMKPSLVYFLTALQVSYEHVDRVRLELDAWGDVYTFAYLHGTIGLDWTQLDIILQAFPCLAVCSTEPTWEMLDFGKAARMRSTLLEDSLHWLQRHLQVGPTTVEAMLKTHPPLSSYSVDGKMRPTFNALQEKLGLSSKQVRKIVLRMPSLIGMSTVESSETGLMQRLVFFYDEVGMTQNELRNAVLRQPSLLQYSVDKSLRPKLNFFVDELQVPLEQVPRMIATMPALWGLSLDETLRPKSNAMVERCGFTHKEFGGIIYKVPAILAQSWSRNLKPKLDYLQTRLCLSQKQLKNLIATTPRVLLYSVETSLERKLQMIEAAVEGKDSASVAMNIVRKNPSLLVMTVDGLKQRINKSRSVKIGLAPRPKRTTRRKRSVLQVDPATNNVIQVFPSASVAAQKLETSLPNMYNICLSGRLFNGNKFVYGTLHGVDDDASVEPIRISTVDSREERPKETKPLAFKDLKSALAASKSEYPLVVPTTENATIRIAVYTAGGVYPPDRSVDVRGTRRSGGMVLWFPQMNKRCGPELAMRLRLAAKKSFGQIMPHDDNGSGTCYHDGRILIGFPYLRPSRNRCELYACHEAIKVVASLLKQESTEISLANESVQVDVYTDSDYAWKLLQNTTQLANWGSIVDERDFCYDGPLPSERANPDLLHPLCRTYFRLVNQQDSDLSPLVLGEHVSVTFHHASGSMASLHEYAKEAAMWMDQRAKTAIAL